MEGDAIAPLGMLVPVVIIGGQLFTLPALASYMGAVGVIGLILGSAMKSKQGASVLISLLCISVVFFVADSIERLFSTLTAVPFAACAIYCLIRRPSASDTVNKT